MDTYWLVGPKSSYTAAIDQDTYRIHEDSHSAVGQHQANMYDTSNKRGSNINQNEGQLTPTKVPSNVINRRPSIVGGQCPFSGARNGTDS